MSPRRLPVVDEQFVAVPIEGLHTVVLDSEAIVLDEQHDRLHHLNATATLLWRCFDGVATVGAIVSDLSAELGAPRETMLVGALAVTAQLRDEGLLALDDQSGADQDT